MKSLRKYIPLLALTACLSASAFAVNDGGDHSGGGSDAVAAFVRSAKNELDKLELKKQSEVDVSVLRNTLDTAQFKVTSTLVDPRTGTAVDEGEHLIAYGSPGLIQLKPDWSERVEGPKRVVHHIVHELMRASGKYNDEGYRITIGKLNLDLDSCSTCTPVSKSNFSNIGQGTIIRLNADLCFDANTERDRTSSRPPRRALYRNFSCTIKARKVAPYPRVIPAGTVYRVTGVQTETAHNIYNHQSIYSHQTVLSLDSDTIDSITCTAAAENGSFGGPITIAEFHDWMAGALELSPISAEVVR